MVLDTADASGDQDTESARSNSSSAVIRLDFGGSVGTLEMQFRTRAHAQAWAGSLAATKEAPRDSLSKRGMRASITSGGEESKALPSGPSMRGVEEGGGKRVSVLPTQGQAKV